jgi:hypothetical protein
LEEEEEEEEEEEDDDDICACTNEGVSKSFRTQSITKYTFTFGITRSEATQKVMAAKLTILTHKIAIQLHLVAESRIICSSRSRWPVRKLLDTPSYISEETNVESNFTNIDINDNFRSESVLLYNFSGVILSLRNADTARDIITWKKFASSKVFSWVYRHVSGPAGWSENCKWYSSLPLGSIVSLLCEPV